MIKKIFISLSFCSLVSLQSFANSDLSQKMENYTKQNFKVMVKEAQFISSNDPSKKFKQKVSDNLDISMTNEEPSAFFVKGFLLIQGTYLDKDEDMGVKLLELGSQLGNADSNYMLYLTNLEGRYGITSNFDKGYNYLRKAVDLRHPYALYDYGYLLFNKAKNPKQKRTGIIFIEQSASMGFFKAKKFMKEYNSRLEREQR